MTVLPDSLEILAVARISLKCPPLNYLPIDDYFDLDYDKIAKDFQFTPDAIFEWNRGVSNQALFKKSGFDFYEIDKALFHTLKYILRYTCKQNSIIVGNTTRIVQRFLRKIVGTPWKELGDAKFINNNYRYPVAYTTRDYLQYLKQNLPEKYKIIFEST